MRIVISFIAAIMLIVSCKQKDKNQSGGNGATDKTKTGDSLLVTDSSWGWITASANIDDLKKLYGGANVKDERICGPECVDSFDVTLLYAGSDRETIVYWEDSFYHKKVNMVRCIIPGAPYHTAGGLKIGTSLNELLKMNGKPIAFLGFGWDYGGGILSLNHGVLENSRIHFNLDISEDPTGNNAVYGDTELNSDMPEVKRVADKIHVSEILLPFNY